MRVSVVVPVYNPGDSLRRSVESLLTQSLPPESTELIFVDDGSTDGSGDLLDELAARHSHLQVIHEPNSGWSGRPRNVGLDAATGEFVQFVDQDDALGEQALERLSSYGAANDADIVIGKVISDFRRVPHELFRRNIPRCSIRDTALIRSLTPHKMFRRSFLIDNKLRFAEGRRRLEDQLFMTQVYLATDAVAVLADYPCYFYLRREDRGNSAKPNYDPADYYGYVREVLDVVAAHTASGEFRDSLHERFLNAMLQKVADTLQPRREKRLIALMAEINAVADAYFSPQVAQRAPILRRQLAAAIRRGEPETVREASGRYDDLAATVRSLTVETSADNGWTVSVTAAMTFRDGSPILFQPAADGWRVDQRLQVDGLEVGVESMDELLHRTSGDLVLRSSETPLEWLGATPLTPSFDPHPTIDGAHHLQLTGTVEIDPSSFAAGAPLPAGTWRVSVRLTALGRSRSTPIRRRHVGQLPRRNARGRRGAATLQFSDRRLSVLVPS